MLTDLWRGEYSGERAHVETLQQAANRRQRGDEIHVGESGRHLEVPRGFDGLQEGQEVESS